MDGRNFKYLTCCYYCEELLAFLIKLDIQSNLFIFLHMTKKSRIIIKIISIHSHNLNQKLIQDLAFDLTNRIW